MKTSVFALLICCVSACVMEDAVSENSSNDVDGNVGNLALREADSDKLINVREVASLPVGITFGPVRLIAQNSQKCLDVTGGPRATGDGVPVQQWDCLSSRPANQLWDLRPTGDGLSIYITARHSGKCLDVTGGPGATGNGVFVQQFTCLPDRDNRNQRWAANPSDNIFAIHSGRCLDVRGGPGATGNGVRIQQWDCFLPARTNQVWNIAM